MDADDEIKSVKISNKFKYFNFIIFGLIIIIAALYCVYISSYEDTPALDFPEYSYVISSLTCGIIALIVGIRFRFHDTFRTSYIALGISFLLLSIGEVTYIAYYYFLEIDAFPSMADVFFLSSAIFAFIHLIMNINYFKTKISSKTKIILPIIGISIITIFSLFSFHSKGEVNLEFIVGILYANNYSILIPLLILGMIVSQKSKLGSTWLLLVIGMFFLGIGKIWWIHLEFFEGFTYGHPVNAIWLFGYMTIAFGLIMHIQNKKILSSKN